MGRMKEGCLYKGNIVRGLINGVELKIEGIKNDNGVTFVHFRDLKTEILHKVPYECARRLLLEEVKR